MAVDVVPIARCNSRCLETDRSVSLQNYKVSNTSILAKRLEETRLDDSHLR